MHSAGTYRTGDGRGGAVPASSASRPSTVGPTTRTSTRRAAALADQAEVWQENLMADLMILAATSPESMGFKTFGFAGGREDVWEPEEDVYWVLEQVAG